MVLIKVDLPSPVWPVRSSRLANVCRDAVQGDPRGGRSVCKLTNADDVELETTLQELALDLRRDAVETNVALGVDGAGGHGGHRDGETVRVSRERLLC